MIHRLIILLLIVGCGFADEYPSFSDINKQLMFEKQRIYIRSLELPKETTAEIIFPDTIISVKYKISNYEIIKDNNQISEREFLNIVGLHDEINELNKNYQLNISNHNKAIELFDKKIKRDDRTTGIVFLASTILFRNNLSRDDFGIDGMIGLLGYCQNYIYLFIRWNSIYYKRPQLELEDHFSYEQILSLAENYNKTIYKIIKNNNP